MLCTTEKCQDGISSPALLPTIPHEGALHSAQSVYSPGFVAHGALMPLHLWVPPGRVEMVS